MRSAEVLVAGQVARDLVLVVDEAPGPGQAVGVDARREMLGGKGANQAVALAQLGVPVSLLGVVGSDRTGQRLLARARADGVGVWPSVQRASTETALIVDVVDQHGQWRYLEHIPAGTLLNPADVDAAAEAVRLARVVSVQLQQPGAAVRAVLRHARAAGRRIVVDGAPTDTSLRAAVLGAAEVVRADAKEAELLTGTPVEDVATAVRAAQGLLRQGPSLVALAVDGVGNVFCWPGHSMFLPLVDTEVVDTTGAGDAFVAGLIAAILRGDEPEQAARVAVAAAAATVGHPGGRPDLTGGALQRQLAAVDAGLATRQEDTHSKGAIEMSQQPSEWQPMEDNRTDLDWPAPGTADEVTVPPTDPVREAKQRDLDDPAHFDLDPEQWRQGSPTRSAGARTTTGGTAGPAMRRRPGRRNAESTAPTTPGDATSGGMDHPTSGTTSDATGEALPADESEAD